MPENPLTVSPPGKGLWGKGSLHSKHPLQEDRCTAPRPHQHSTTTNKAAERLSEFKILTAPSLFPARSRSTSPMGRTDYGSPSHQEVERRFFYYTYIQFLQIGSITIFDIFWFSCFTDESFSRMYSP